MGDTGSALEALAAANVDDGSAVVPLLLISIEPVAVGPKASDIGDTDPSELSGAPTPALTEYPPERMSGLLLSSMSEHEDVDMGEDGVGRALLMGETWERSSISTSSRDAGRLAGEDPEVVDFAERLTRGSLSRGKSTSMLGVRKERELGTSGSPQAG